MSNAIATKRTAPRKGHKMADNKKAVAAIREFDLHLWFAEGELFKTVKILHPEWTAQRLMNAIRVEKNNAMKGIPVENVKGVPDLISAGSEKGELFLDGFDSKGRPSKNYRHRIIVAIWWVSDGMGAVASSFNAHYCFDDGSSIEL